MYYCGQGVPQDYAQARTYFEQVVANPDIDPRVTANARYMLGEIYYLGGHGVPRDYVTARTYFEQVVANSDDNPTVIAMQDIYLAKSIISAKEFLKITHELALILSKW